MTKRMITPDNGPGHTMRPLPRFDAPTNKPHRSGTTTGSWTPPQMTCTREDGEKFLAANTVENGMPVPRARPVAYCVGVAVTGSLGAGSPRRFT